jgi:rhodanese-related sulfurtransferase
MAGLQPFACLTECHGIFFISMRRGTKRHKQAAKAFRTARDLVREAKRKVTLISCEEAMRRLEQVENAPVLIDVREELEHEMIRLGESVHISRGTLEMTVEHDYPDRNTPILLYCSSGNRSALAALTLKSMGYRHVATIDGGLHAWQEKGLPVVFPAQQSGPGSGT